MVVPVPIRQMLPAQESLLSHEEEPPDHQADRVEVCVQVAPVSEEIPNATRMTGMTEGRTLACAGPVPSPARRRRRRERTGADLRPPRVDLFEAPPEL